MTTTSLSVPAISCEHCKMSIEGAVGVLPGVDRVGVEVDPKTVHVAFDEEMVSLDQIIDAIQDQGYDVER